MVTVVSLAGNGVTPVGTNWSMRTPRYKLIRIGAEVAYHPRSVMLQLAEEVVPRSLFAAILGRAKFDWCSYLFRRLARCVTRSVSSLLSGRSDRTYKCLDTFPL